jgi:SAM-dependent methyltransferase
LTDPLLKPAPRDHFVTLFPLWSSAGPPLRPSPRDTAVLVEHAALAFAQGAPTRVVVLGLTPESITAAYPTGTSLVAVDHSQAMIDRMWPPEGRPEDSRVALADWAKMPIGSESVGLVAGDGCNVLLPWPDGISDLLAELHRVLAPEGRAALRVFLRPDVATTVEQVQQDLLEGRVESVHALKLKLHAALHGASGPGTLLDDTWKAWKSLKLPDDLAGRPGWTPAELETIEAYAGMTTRYYLATIAEFRALLAPLFREVDHVPGDHGMGALCPTFVLVPTEDLA